MIRDRGGGGGGGGRWERKKVWDRETMFSQLKKRFTIQQFFFAIRCVARAA